MASAPGNWPECRYLRANPEVNERGEFGRRDRVNDPADHDSNDPRHDDADGIDLRRSRQRAKGGQDSGILEPGLRLQGL